MLGLSSGLDGVLDCYDDLCSTGKTVHLTVQQMGFQWKRFWIGGVILFLTVELVWLSLTLVGVAGVFVWQFRSIPSMAGDPARTSFSLASAGLLEIAIPVAVYSFISSAAFVQFRWTRNLKLALGGSILLALEIFYLSCILTSNSGGTRGTPAWVLGVSIFATIGAAMVGTRVVHRYSKTVERPCRR